MKSDDYHNIISVCHLLHASKLSFLFGSSLVVCAYVRHFRLNSCGLLILFSCVSFLSRLWHFVRVCSFLFFLLYFHINLCVFVYFAQLRLIFVTFVTFCACLFIFVLFGTCSNYFARFVHVVQLCVIFVTFGTFCASFFIFVFFLCFHIILRHLLNFTSTFSDLHLFLNVFDALVQI